MFKIRRPDPSYLTSERSRANFRLALKAVLGFVVLLWLIHIVNFLLGYRLNALGVLPREFTGLRGVLFSPLLHANFKHLFDNSVPLAVIGTLGLFVYPNSLTRSLPIIYLGSGILVWMLAGGNSIHIGASGLIYGLLAFVFFSGLLKRDARGITVSMLVWFLYASLSLGILPQPGPISWESHLFGAIAGTALAWYHRGDTPPERRYSWDEEE